MGTRETDGKMRRKDEQDGAGQRGVKEGEGADERGSGREASVGQR